MPFAFSTLSAYLSQSGAFFIIPSSSRSHCITEPALKAEPSIQYSTSSPMPHAIPVTRLFFDVTLFLPVLAVLI